MRQALEDEQVHCHPFVVGELATGNLPRRDAVLAELTQLPVVEVASHDEAMALLTRRRLSGRGLSWIDVHLLASALVSHVKLWTLDQRLASAARALGIAANLR